MFLKIYLLYDCPMSMNLSQKNLLSQFTHTENGDDTEVKRPTDAIQSMEHMNDEKDTFIEMYVDPERMEIVCTVLE